MAQLIPLPLTVSCFSKIQIGFTCLVLARPGSPGKRAVKRVCVCVCARACVRACVRVCVRVSERERAVIENTQSVCYTVFLVRYGGNLVIPEEKLSLS